MTLKYVPLVCLLVIQVVASVQWDYMGKGVCTGAPISAYINHNLVSCQKLCAEFEGCVKLSAPAATGNCYLFDADGNCQNRITRSSWINYRSFVLLSSAPTKSPTSPPTSSPSSAPTAFPTFSPTFYPTLTPSFNPTYTPTNSPSSSPSLSPTRSPTDTPSQTPTIVPTISPISVPSLSPTASPSWNPSSYIAAKTTRLILEAVELAADKLSEGKYNCPGSAVEKCSLSTYEAVNNSRNISVCEKRDYVFENFTSCLSLYCDQALVAWCGMTFENISSCGVPAFCNAFGNNDTVQRVHGILSLIIWSLLVSYLIVVLVWLGCTERLNEKLNKTCILYMQILVDKFLLILAVLNLLADSLFASELVNDPNHLSAGVALITLLLLLVLLNSSVSYVILSGNRNSADGGCFSKGNRYGFSCLFSLGGLDIDKTALASGRRRQLMFAATHYGLLTNTILEDLPVIFTASLLDSRYTYSTLVSLLSSIINVIATGFTLFFTSRAVPTKPVKQGFVGDPQYQKPRRVSDLNSEEKGHANNELLSENQNAAELIRT